MKARARAKRRDLKKSLKKSIKEKKKVSQGAGGSALAPTLPVEAAVAYSSAGSASTTPTAAPMPKPAATSATLLPPPQKEDRAVPLLPPPPKEEKSATLLPPPPKEERPGRQRGRTNIHNVHSASVLPAPPPPGPPPELKDGELDNLGDSSDSPLLSSYPGHSGGSLILPPPRSKVPLQKNSNVLPPPPRPGVGVEGDKVEKVSDTKPVEAGGKGQALTPGRNNAGAVVETDAETSLATATVKGGAAGASVTASESTEVGSIEQAIGVPSSAVARGRARSGSTHLRALDGAKPLSALLQSKDRVKSDEKDTAAPEKQEEQQVKEDWIEHVAENGEIYYENTKTGETSWEKRLADEWIVHVTADGEEYYENGKTGEVTWDKPKEQTEEGGGNSDEEDDEGDKYFWVPNDKLCFHPAKLLSESTDVDSEESLEFVLGNG